MMSFDIDSLMVPGVDMKYFHCVQYGLVKEEYKMRSFINMNHEVQACYKRNISRNEHAWLN